MTSASSTRVHLLLKRDGANVARRVALWRDTLAPSGRVDVADKHSFEGELISRTIGEMRTISIASSTFRFVRDKAMVQRIRRDHVIVNLVEGGRVQGKLAGRCVLLEPGALVLSRLASSMNLLVEEARWRALVFPKQLLERHMSWSPALDGRVFAPGTAQAGLLGGLLRSLADLPDPLPVREATCAIQSTLALLAACLGRSPPTPPGTGDEDPARAIRRFIADRLADPDLGINLICRQFDISRSRLYRTMGEGADIARMVRRMRLHAAQREIASDRLSHLSLAAIGQRWGLADERGFRRAFVREFGYPPSTLRRHDGGDAGSTTDVSAGLGADLERWFEGLDT